MTYNGWTNYETWVVKLWIDNDEVGQEFWCEQAREATSVSELEDLLKESHEGQLADVPPGWCADITRSAFGRVDWHEIAKSLWDDAHEDDETCSVCGDVLDDDAENGRCEDCADVADPS